MLSEYGGCCKIAHCADKKVVDAMKNFVLGHKSCPSTSDPSCFDDAYILLLISSRSFCNSPLSASLVGHPIPNPSDSFGFGIKWKCT